MNNLQVPTDVQMQMIMDAQDKAQQEQMARQPTKGEMRRTTCLQFALSFMASSDEGARFADVSELIKGAEKMDKFISSGSNS